METMYTDGTYLQHNKDWHQSESGWKSAKVIDAIRKNNLKPSTVCDVGCGFGWILKNLNESFKDPSIMYSGYDIAPEAIKGSAQNAAPNISFFNKNILEEQVNFDLVMALDVVEHVEDCFTFLRELRNKATYKLFHIPLGLFMLKVLFPQGFLKERRDHGHIQYFNKEIVFALLKETGYTIIDWEFLPKRLEVPNPGKLAEMLRLPRKIMYKLNKELAARILGGFSLSVLAK